MPREARRAARRTADPRPPVPGLAHGAAEGRQLPHAVAPPPLQATIAPRWHTLRVRTQQKARTPVARSYFQSAPGIQRCAVRVSALKTGCAACRTAINTTKAAFHPAHLPNPRLKPGTLKPGAGSASAPSGRERNNLGPMAAWPRQKRARRADMKYLRASL